MADTEGVNIVISGDSSQAVKEVDKVTNAIDNVKGTNIKITADSSQAVDEAHKVASSVESINDAHAEITADSSQAVDEAGKASSAMDNINDAHSEITADASQAVDEVNKLADAEEALNDAHVDITADSSQAVDEAEKAANALDNVGNAHSTITADGSQAIDEAGKVQKIIADINGKKVTFTVSPIIKDSQGRLSDIHRRFLGMGREAGQAFSSEFSSASVQGIEKSLGSMLALNVGDKLASGFGTILTSITDALQRVAGAVSSVMKSALAIGGGFEAQMTSVQVISGATGKDLQDLTDKAREMGATLPISARDAATAMTLLAQRGMQAKDILATVAEVANLTISQGVDMGSAADILGSTMTNFGISVNDASKITAVFNNACNQSALSMSKLIEAMKYVGPAAGAVNMSLTEAVSGMEAIANAGLTGEMTGTGLAMVLSKLAANATIMGVKTKELDGSLRPLKDIFSELKNNGFSLAEAIEAFGQRGSKAALALANNSDKLAENEAKLKQWGSTQSAVDAKAKTFTNTMAALKSAIEEFHIEIFTQIKDQAKDAVGSVAGLTREFSKWVGESQIAGKALNSFLEGLGFKLPSVSDFKKLLDEFDVQSFVDKVKDFASTLRGIGESIVSFFNTVKTPLAWLIEHLDTFATISFWGWILGKGLQIPAAILGIATALKTLTSVAKGFLGLSWATILAHPIGAALATAGAIGGVAYYVYSKSQQAAKEEKRVKAEAERIRREVEEANKDLQFHVDIDFKTGFEELPASFEKASAELRQEIKENIAFLQEEFRGKAAQAVEFVTAKFPEMAKEFNGSANDISDSILTQISAALKGSEKDFEALPEIWRKVAERINAVDSGLDKFGIDLLGVTEKYRQLQNVIIQPVKKSESEVFFEELYANIRNITQSLSGEIQRAQSFLNASDGQLAINVSISQAQKKLEQFSKSAAEKYAIPEDIVKASLIERLNQLALAGNDSAQSLVNGFNNAGDTLNTFLTNAQEAINYLGASPDKFMPALNTMMKGIQRVDPLTGKLTENFKKAYNALKQWGNVTFDQLTNRIQKLRKAVEGGFIDSSALEAEFFRVMPQLKLQVVNDLQPQREQYRTRFDYQSVVASEFISRISDLFGDMGVDLARKMFNVQNGAEMGYAIVAEVERGLSNSSATFQINGVDQLQNGLSQFSQGLNSIASLPQDISNAINPFLANLGQISISQTGDNMSGITLDFQKITASIDNAKSSVDSNSSVVASLNEAILKLVASAGNFSADKSSPAYSFKDYSSDLAHVLTEFQNVSSILTSIEDAIKSKTFDAPISLDENKIAQAITDGLDNIGYDFGSAIIAEVERELSNISATFQINGIEQLTQGLEAITILPQNISEAINPYVAKLEQLNSTQNSHDSLPAAKDYSAVIASVVSEIKASSNANVTALNNVTAATIAVENAVKSHQPDNSQLNISQAFSNAIAPLVSRIEQNGTVYQSSSATIAKSIQDLGGNINILKKSADDNISAMSQLQASVKAAGDSFEAGNITGSFAPLVATVQNLVPILTNIQKLQQDNSSALSNVITSLQSLEAGNNYNIDINQQGFIIEKKSDADLLARSTVSALKSGIGNGGI